MKIGVVTDSLACLREEKIELDNVKVVNLSVNSKDKSYIENIDLDLDEYYKLKGEGIKFKSSQPSPSAFEEAYNLLKAEGCTDVISIHPVNVMSGTINSSRIGGELVEGINVHNFEGMCAAFEEEMNVDETVKMISEGKSVSEILERLTYLRGITENYVIVEDLMVLAEAGRLRKTQAAIGNLIHLKPMIRLGDGGFSLLHKYRTTKKVANQIVEEIKLFHKNHGKTKIYITPIDEDKLVNLIIKGLDEIKDDVVINIGRSIGPVLAVNFGPKGLGICWTEQ